MDKTVDTVERERESRIQKNQLFCDAKKVENIFKIERINMYVNKTECQGVLENFEVLMLRDSLFFR